MAKAYGKLPLSFETNQGQTDRRVRFLSRGSGYNLFLANTEAVLQLQHTDFAAQNEKAVRSASDSENPQSIVLRTKFVGARRTARVEGENEQSGKVNYILGNDPRKWRADISTYAKVTYKNLYPGIDLSYYGNQQQLEYDFVVAPGADPRAIRLDLQGADKIQVDDRGDLLMAVAGGTVRQRKPAVYQEVNGVREQIASRYVLLHTGDPRLRTVGFQLGEYNSSRPLVIDPILDYSTYLGGIGSDTARSIAVDSDGNAYISGQTTSPNFPTASGPSPIIKGVADAFVVKLNAAGTALVYSTVFGGSGSESARGVAVDAHGDAYLTGFTSSADFPTVHPIQPVYGGGAHDAFVAKLNATGSAFIYSTYLGGTGDEAGYNIAVRHGSAFVTGVTNSINFPTENPLQPHNAGGYDAFVTRVNRAGTELVYSTYLGGSGDDVQISSGDSTGVTSSAGIAVDEDDHAYISGTTDSKDFPTKNPIQPHFAGTVGYPCGPTPPFCDYNAFVAKLSSRGSRLIYSTYLGGNAVDNGNRLAIDGDGNAYVEGSTNSTNFPTKNAIYSSFQGGFSDIFVTKINAAGTALVYSTYLGGKGDDYGFGLAVDRGGSAYLAGQTNSTDFPTVNPIQASHSPGFNFDVVAARLNPSGSALLYSTYLGGTGDDAALGLATRSGAAYITGYTTSSLDFPTTPHAFQPTYGGGSSDAFITKIIDAPETEAQCKNNGWQKFGAPAGPFKNQGQCIDAVEDQRDRDADDREGGDDDDHDHDPDH
jgi:hypothetical protein